MLSDHVWEMMMNEYGPVSVQITLFIVLTKPLSSAYISSDPHPHALEEKQL